MQTSNQTSRPPAYRYKEPPPYPGLGRPLYQPRLRQSYSGSETSTDLSLSSSENICTSVRQEPQGEETNTAALSPIEPPRDRGVLYMAAQPPGFEVKSTNSGTFYVTGNMAQPKPTICTGGHTHHLGNVGHHGNGSHGQLKYNTNNNNNSLSQGYVGGGDIKPPSPISPHLSQAKSLMSQYYQSDALRSLCQQMCNPHKLYPSAALSGAVPGKGVKGSPLEQHFSQQSTPVSTGPGIPQRQGILQGPGVPQRQGIPQGQAIPHYENNQSLSQLMSALNRNSVTQSSMPASSRERQRPSTAPTMRHLPAPPQYPGHGHDPRLSPDLESLSLRRSQPDLSRLAELSLPRQYDIPLPAELSKPSRPSNLPIHLNNLHHSRDNNNNSHNHSNQQAGQTTAALVQQLQYLQNRAIGKPSPDPQPTVIRPMTAPSSQAPITDPLVSMTARPGSVPPSPDKLQHGTHSPNLRKLSELDYASQVPRSNQLTDVATIATRTTPLVDHAAIATRATQMVERLSEENQCLRQELEGYYKKVYRLQKLEHEMQKVHENYEILVKHSHKQQSLEKLMRLKLESEVKLLRETNKELKDQLDKALRQLQQKEIYALLDSDIKKELLSKDSLIAKLISQNQDLTTTREQLEHDYTSQKSAMHDQSVHLKLLEAALTSTRAELLKHEEEYRKRKCDDDRIIELQKALSQLQVIAETREAIEQKLRQKLEEEVQYLRNQQVTMNKVTEADEGISSDTESPTSLKGLVRQMTEKDQRILMLEADVAKVKVILLLMWKQKCLEETAMKQFAVDAASVSKDARIASLEQSSLDTEKRMAQTRTDCMKQMDEAHSANSKCAELEAKLKTVRAQLAEKDAMITILHRHTGVTCHSSIASLLGSPLHSPHPSFNRSPLVSPISSPLISHAPPSTGASSRQNSQLDSSSTYSSGSSSTGGISTTDTEGNTPAHSKTSSTGSAVSSTSSSSSKDNQLRDIQQKLLAKAVLFGGGPTGSDQLKKYLWQV